MRAIACRTVAGCTGARVDTMSVTVTYDDGAPEIICAPATNAAELTFADTPLVTARCSNVVPFCPDQCPSP